MSNLWVDGLGWIGAMLLLIAYALVSLRGYKGTSVIDDGLPYLAME